MSRYEEECDFELLVSIIMSTSFSKILHTLLAPSNLCLGAVDRKREVAIRSSSGAVALRCSVRVSLPTIDVGSALPNVLDGSSVASPNLKASS
jgi:hypothetical protein